MARTTHLRITAAGLIAATWFSVSPVESVIRPTSDPKVTVSSETAAEANPELVDWAMARFAETGLSLPDLHVSFHPRTSEECPGIGIALWTAGEEAHRIRVCSPSKRVVLHELGHAWAHENLSHSVVDEFLTTLGLASWDSADIEHAQRGMEQAADIIAWGLLDRRDEMPHLGDIDIAAAYELLTGNRSPYRAADELPPDPPPAPAPEAARTTNPTGAEPSRMIPLLDAPATG